MRYSPELAEIRFGCGLSPDLAPPGDAQSMLDGLTAADAMAQRYPIEDFDRFLERVRQQRQLRRTQVRNPGTPEAAEARKRARQMNRDVRAAAAGWYGQSVLRWVRSQQGFRERLVGFWADHFTAMGKMGVTLGATAPYVEEAIRPNLTGTFADLLIASVTHPLMLLYLDQGTSIGPNSRLAKRNKRLKGLNENLAREVLELHTLGVDGPYDQSDVRQLARLFTGLSFSAKDGFIFRPAFVEPGNKTVLGKPYGGRRPSIAPIHAVLRDLATHPATADHIARKLAVHFVSDAPAPALVDHIAARYRDSGGRLLKVYEALLEHPLAWDATPGNVKPAADFIASACRALAVPPRRIVNADARRIRRVLLAPMAQMGQLWQRPGGPDGWPEEDAAWITPQGLSARMRWAMAAPQVLRPDLPDPRRFVDQALGPFVSDTVRFAANAAESKPEAIALILSSPGFQRR